MKHLLLKLLMVLCMTAIICCSNENLMTRNEDTTTTTISMKIESDNAAITRKQQLIDLAIAGNWQSSDEEVQEALLLAFPEEISRGALLKIKKIDETSVSVMSHINTSRSDVAEGCNDFQFDLYSLESDTYNGYAVTSNDKRIGNVISIVDSEFSEDISDNDFAVMYAEQLEDYIQETADLWNSITDNEISESPISRQGNISSSGNTNYTYSAWQQNYGNNSHEIKTKWNQGYPYNSCIDAIKGLSAPAGCGAVQVAQIMAFHKYPTNMTTPNLSAITSKWSYASSWDGKYDWTTLTETPNWNTIKSRIQIGAFLYDVAEGCKSTYSTDGTSTRESNRLGYLLSQGYVFSGVSGYSLSNIKKSIDAGCPVPIRGSSIKKVKTTTTTYRFLFWTWKKTSTSTSYEGGHAFIVDGYYNMSCTATNGNQTKKITADYVHVNPGWGGYQNGYYLSGVFDMNAGALIDDEAIDNGRGTVSYGNTMNYQYKLSQINMLRPRRK